ncbi:MAG: HD domain-containing protein [Moheibacter sp.]
MIFRAIKFVAEAHEGHYRKGTNIPYISHLTNVMKILCENGCGQEVIVAGILHDAVEDTPVSLDVIKLKFGDRVAELVAAVSEKEKLETGNQEEAGWKERKQHTIDSLQKTDSVDKLLVSCADKLDNTRAILQDYRKLGNQLWTRFNAGKEEQKWYYQSLAEVFVTRGNEFGEPLKNIANEMKSTVDLIFENK